jgi:diguanylate cyclase (GGDEF)-like protein
VGGDDELAGRCALLEEALGRLEEAVVLVDAAGTVVFANPAGAALAGELPLERAAREPIRGLELEIGGRSLRVDALPLSTGALVVGRDLSELRQLALIDDLTGLANRRGFMTLAEQQIKLADRSRKPFLIFFVDLDAMKDINDGLGHEAGDQALRDVAGLLRSTFRRSDVVARFGGDEFAVLAVDASPAHGEVFTSRLAAGLVALNQMPGRRFHIEISTGLTTYDPEHPDALETLLARADARMYEEKRRRKGRG